jgi:hypothetical protein
LTLRSPGYYGPLNLLRAIPIPLKHVFKTERLFDLLHFVAHLVS